MQRRTFLRVLGSAVITAAALNHLPIPDLPPTINDEDVMRYIVGMMERGLQAYDDLVEKALFEHSSHLLYSVPYHRP